MKQEERYDRIVGLLRKSKPDPGPTYDIEMKVLERIEKGRHRNILSDISGFLFGWADIVWVRRSLVVASVIIVIVFVLQQNRILNQMEYLSTQITVGRSDELFSSLSERSLTSYRLRGNLFRLNRIRIPENELIKLIDSIDELKSRYGDVMKIIEQDPGLRKMVEERLRENDRLKIKL